MTAAMPKPVWASFIAKMTAPLDAERAGKAIAGLALMLAYPDAAFCLTSAKFVATEGRVMEAEVRGAGGAIVKTAAYGPMTRVPTYGEIDAALGRWWWQHRDMARVAAAPVARERLAAPETREATPDETDAAKAHVAALVGTFVSERSWKDPNHVEHRAAVKACPLSDGQLLATWLKAEADGVVGASIRVAQLRERLGATEITP